MEAEEAKGRGDSGGASAETEAEASGGNSVEEDDSTGALDESEQKPERHCDERFSLDGQEFVSLTI